MKYRIIAPSEQYERRIGGLRFAAGTAETENAWLAGWFSGRPGFTVTPVQEGGEKKKGGRTRNAEGRSAGEAGDPAAEGIDRNA